MIRRYLALKRAGVMGLNARNGQYIMRYNQRKFYPLVDDKIRSKKVLQEHGIAVPDLLDEIRTQHDAGHLAKRLAGLSEFVLKPACGSGGDGIIVISKYRNERWLSPGGRSYSLDDLQFHVSGILNGMYSLAGQPDAAMFEALVHPDPILRELAPEGVPDIRVIIYRGIPVMAMMRLPTRQSGGRANLHQGAIGVGIDMASGRTLFGVMESRIIEQHPDSGFPVERFEVPDWTALLDLAARCQKAVGLGYLGVDIVLDAQRGPLVLELNARPGLAIQIANQAGLERRLKAVDRLADPEKMSPGERLDWLARMADSDWSSKSAESISAISPTH